jgi:chromosome segregation ATPase
MELTGGLDGANKKLQGALEQYNSAAHQLQIFEKESHQYRTALDQALNARKISETKIVELTSRLTEITNINVSLTQKTTKIEKDLQSISADYSDIARELKLADERANKASHDAQYCEGLLREEQTKVLKSETARKALETEVRSLTVRMEEIESSSISSSKRTIQKMEMRIEELEVLLTKEKQLHVETTTQLHKRDRSFKELLLQSEEDRKNILILQESLDRLNEKIKMYKRQLEEQESISNSNIMRVKKFQRELESAEGRASEAESCLNSFRSRQRVFAAAETRKENVSDEVEREVVIKKVIHNVNASNVSDSYTSASRNEVTATARYL